MGSTAGARGAQHTTEMVSILFGEDIGERPLTIGLIDILSPSSYSSEMLEALLVYGTPPPRSSACRRRGLSGDGLVHTFVPKGQSFAALVTLSLPISPVRAGAAVHIGTAIDREILLLPTGPAGSLTFANAARRFL